MATHVTPLSFHAVRIPAGTTSWLRGTIVDDDGDGFQPDQVRLTLRDRATGAIINGREDVDITASVSAGGALNHELTPDDNVLITTSRQYEQHSALLTWTWGDRVGKARVDFYVERIGGTS